MVGCAVLCCAVPCCDALFRDGWDRDKEVAGDDMVVVPPPQNWLISYYEYYYLYSPRL